MSEYIDYPLPPHMSHVDVSFGREYDPYPDNRTGRKMMMSPRAAPSWISTGTNPLQSPRMHATPATSPINLNSPVPAVHRLDGEPARSPRAAAAMPGASRFREADQAEPTRWTQATNVSYPASHGASWISTNVPPPPQHMRSDSFFTPRGASTPAPQTRYGENAPIPGGFPEGVSGRYGEPEGYRNEQDGYPVEEKGYERVPQGYSGEPNGYRRGPPGYNAEPECSSFQVINDSGYPAPSTRYGEAGDETGRSLEEQTEEFEQEYVPGSYSHSNGEPGEEQMSVHQSEEHRASPDSFKVFERHEPPPEEPKRKGRGFVGGFMMGLRNIPKKLSKSGSHKSYQVTPVHPITPPAEQPSRPALMRAHPSYANIHPQAPGLLQSPVRPPQSPPQRSQSRSPRSPARPPNPAPATTAHMSRDTDPTATSISGPLTPDQSMAPPDVTVPAADDGPVAFDAFPNPYDPSPFPQAEPLIHSPEQAQLQPTGDYNAMEESYYDSQPDAPDTTFASRMNSVGRFFTELVHLPWINAQATVVYRPTESRRARYAGPKPGRSWYAKEHTEKLDLLATPTVARPRPRPRAATQPLPQPQPRGVPAQQSRAPRQQRPRAPRSVGSSSATSSRADAATAIRPTRTPASLTTHGGLVRAASPGASSHGQAPHSFSTQYFYAPQPLYVYPGAVAPTAPGQPGAGTGAGQTNGQTNGQAAGQATAAAGQGAAQMAAGPLAIPFRLPGPDGQQAVPVFMLAAPAPMVLPGSPPRRHKHRRTTGSQSPTARRAQGAQERRKTASPPPPMPVPQVHIPP